MQGLVRIGGVVTLLDQPAGEMLGGDGMAGNLDGLAARLAATRGTETDWAQVFFLVAQLRTAADETELAHSHRILHREIYAIAFSPRLTALFNSQLIPYISEVVNVGPGKHSDPEGAFHQHLSLVRALSSGDAELAAQASRDHAASGARYAKSLSEIADPHDQ